MDYSAKAVANYFLAKHGDHGITPLTLQKLVYIAHGWFMAIYNNELLVGDEFAEAWEFGPVFPSLYNEFKHFGRSPITTLATSFNDDLQIVTPKIDKSDLRTSKLLDAVWTAYGLRYSGMQLSDLCHAPGSPWDETKKKHGNKRNADIPDSLIAKHYRLLLEQNKEKRMGEPLQA